MTSFVSKQEMTEFIDNDRFRELFIRLGWDLGGLPTDTLYLSGNNLKIERVAHKRGFTLCVCNTTSSYLKTKRERENLARELSKHHHENLLIISNQEKQYWITEVRLPNRPLRKIEIEWHRGQSIEAIMQKLKGIGFSIDEEDNITITDVGSRVQKAWLNNADKVTRKFYGEFQKQLNHFSKFIEGIEEQVSKEWYTALMLNRLMFIYFIQKKGFLDGDHRYLENRLEKTQEQRGSNQFYETFYRNFLRHLFIKGLNTPEDERDGEFTNILGRVPYLNGGLFDMHEIERNHSNIDIPDKAFEKLFAFFNQYQWHLDTRSNSSANEINPDVIGYIFEKYINERAEMGAYYTQDDITGYIARNTIIPFLLNRAKEKCKKAFDDNSVVWRFLRENPDRYIHDAVKKGCSISDADIPENIKEGIDIGAPELLKRRKDWNTLTKDEFALPAETWRETIARRQHYFELKRKIMNGEVCEIDDLTTYNLDIAQFASDAVLLYEGSDFVAALYEAIAGKKSLNSTQKATSGISILDPACGSGAFLFAALNVLEPLYEVCVDRMKGFVAEDDDQFSIGQKKGTKRYQQFRAVLQDIENHKNQRYWIYKTIILNNLYGVDLMKEAAEIAKLRLFLKLAAEADYEPNRPNLGLEPLPDIDYNIRSGNSLTGFTRMQNFIEAVEVEKMDLEEELTRNVQDEAQLVQKANKFFRKAQDIGGKKYQESKKQLTCRINKLNSLMNLRLANLYGKNEEEYEQWIESYNPFHWTVEFYDIIEERGGFDVIIGNPPYIKYSKIKDRYDIKDYTTLSCNNLYALFMELAQLISNQKSHFGMIVPVSLMSAKSMKPLRDIYKRYKIYASSFSDRPSQLFVGPHQTATIFLAIMRPEILNYLHTDRFRHWRKDERKHLFSMLSYTKTEYANDNCWPRLSSQIEHSIMTKINQHVMPMNEYFKRNGEILSICNATGGYWLRAFDEKVSSTAFKVRFTNPGISTALCALINSSLFYWFWRKKSDSRNLQTTDITRFRFDLDTTLKSKLTIAGRQHLSKLKATKEHRSGAISYDQYHPAEAKKEVDKIDEILAECYRLTEEELDYIINYDIKYRMVLGK